MRRTRNAKIVATLGPASTDPEIIEQLFLAGVDVFRLNFSHGSADDHRARAATLREIEHKHGRPIAILADLQGPKLRVGTFEGGPVQLVVGQPFRLQLEPIAGTAQAVTLPHPEIFAALVPGAELLLDDGKLRLKVERCDAGSADTTVLVGGRLSDRKGVNVPGVVLPISALTEKDRRDLEVALEIGADWIALSFVQRPEDIYEARGLVGTRAGMVAKLEKPAAIDRLSAIIELADGIMVARGDLGVELPPENVPTLQKRIIREARAAGRPVIVATQMLESMVNAPSPTRAEASDVSNAVFDGADAIMLSAETAAGAYPVAAVSFMDTIAARVERDPTYQQMLDTQRLPLESSTSSDAITHAAKTIANALGAVAIITITSTGSTTLRAARERPMVPILCVTPDLTKTRKLMLAYGVLVSEGKSFRRFQDKVNSGVEIAQAAGLAKVGDTLVVTAGEGVPGSTNVLRVVTVEETPAH